MRINKWFGKLNIYIEIKWKKHYRHTTGYIQKYIFKSSMKYGTGFAKVSWDVKKPWEFWKR